MFKGIEFSKSKLKSLFFGCQLSNLSAEVYSTANVSRSLMEMGSHLTVLKVDGEWFLMVPHLQWSHTLTSILREAQQPEEFYLTLNARHDLPSPWTSIFQQQHWSRLRVLDLGDGGLDLLSLKVFCASHGGTVREYRLRNITLQGYQYWEDAATALGQLWKLDLLVLWNIRDEQRSRDRGMSSQRMTGIVQRFMHCISESNLGISLGQDFVKAWHKVHHVERPESIYPEEGVTQLQGLFQRSRQILSAPFDD